MKSRRVVFAAVLLAFAWAGVMCTVAMPPAVAHGYRGVKGAWELSSPERG